MSNFEDYFTNPAYAKAYGFNNKGLIYIENERDCAFWEEIIESVIPNKYEVKRSIIDGDPSRGKRGLEKLYSSANENALIAIDSDFDYPCPDRSSYSKNINGKYILHTHSYSRESVICNAASINDTIKKIRLYESSNFDISEPLDAYSTICYKSLIPFLFLMNGRHSIANESEFHSDLVITESSEVKYLNVDGGFNYAILEEIKSKAENRKKYYEKYISDSGLQSHYNDFIESMNRIEISKSSAYRYISGHQLYDNFIIPLIKKIRSRLISLETDKVREDMLGNPLGIRDAVRGVNNHFDSNCSATTLLNNSEKTKEDSIYLKIIDKINKIKASD